MKALTTALFFSMLSVPANAGAILEPPAGTPKVELAVNKQDVSDDAPLRAAIHRSIDDPWRGQTMTPKASNEGLDFPVAERRIGDETGGVFLTTVFE